MEWITLGTGAYLVWRWLFKPKEGHYSGPAPDSAGQPAPDNLPPVHTGSATEFEAS